MRTLTFLFQCALVALCISQLHASQVTVILTKIDDGDAKHVQNGIHQDDQFTLLRESSIPLTSVDPGEPIKIQVDRSQSFQTMYGEGAALTDSSAWVLSELKRHNLELYQYTMKKLFSPTEGAGFSILRLPMGASDYTASPTYYTYCDVPSPDLGHFSTSHDGQNIIPILKDALLLNPQLRILATPWSPPAWMKSNNSLVGIAAEDKARGVTCVLRPDCFEAYAGYFVKFIKEYQAAGVDIWGVTLQNEPQFDGATYPCMRMNEDDQIRLVNLLGPKLATEGLKTKIFVHDHNWGLHPNDRKVIGGDVKMDPVESVTKMFSDSTAGRYIAGSAWHCYYGDDALMTSTYNTIHRRFPDKEILCTESGAWSKNRGNWWGDIDWGMRTVWLGGPQNACQACINWNLALNCDYGPTPRTDSAALGLVNIETGDYQGVRFEREYYAMAQMSRAARPGAKRIAAMFETSATNDLDVIAFGLPGNKTSTVVFNRSQTQQAFQIEADKFFFAFQIPGHSIVTFVW